MQKMTFECNFETRFTCKRRAFKYNFGIRPAFIKKKLKIIASSLLNFSNVNQVHGKKNKKLKIPGSTLIVNFSNVNRVHGKKKKKQKKISNAKEEHLRAILEFVRIHTLSKTS